MTTPVSELHKFIGRTGRIDAWKGAYKLTIPVTIVDARSSAGAAEYEVQPQNGSGTAWVRKLIIDPLPEIGREPA